MIGPGKIRKKQEIVEVRELTKEDLQELKVPRPPMVVQRLRDPHHRLARLVASGLRYKDAAERSGYSYNGVTRLMKDPTFQQLVAEYRERINTEFFEEQDEYYTLATSNMLKAERQLADKLEEAEEQNELLPTKDLLAISRDAADRFGYGKKQTNVNVNVDFAAQMEKALQRSGVQLEGKPALQVMSSRVVASPPTSRQPLPNLRRTLRRA